jgi:hypothetical protein
MLSNTFPAQKLPRAVKTQDKCSRLRRNFLQVLFPSRLGELVLFHHLASTNLSFVRAQHPFASTIGFWRATSSATNFSQTYTSREIIFLSLLHLRSVFHQETILSCQQQDPQSHIINQKSITPTETSSLTKSPGSFQQAYSSIFIVPIRPRHPESEQSIPTFVNVHSTYISIESLSPQTWPLHDLQVVTKHH